MAELDLRPNSIFFHMGPGFHAQIEKHCFGRQYPHVVFLNQPLNLNFSQLTEWACQQVQELSKNCHGPIRLLGHSFGAQLVSEVLSQIPEHVSELRLFNSAYDPIDCFANLEQIMRPTSAQGRSFWRAQSPAEKMNLILQLATDPDFTNYYWLDRKAQSNYQKLSTAYPALDPISFVHTFSTFLEDQKNFKHKPWSGIAEIYYSNSDYLIQNIEVMQNWQREMTNSQFIEIPNLGHYGFFESQIFANVFFN